MKITAAQLKQIIAEQIKEAYLSPHTTLDTGSAELETMLDVICNDWQSQFDPNIHKDDIRKGLDARESWNDQCKSACKLLGEKIEELIMETGYAVHRGEYR